MTRSQPPRHLLTLDDWRADDMEQVLALAADLKRKSDLGERPSLLPRRMLCQIYDKPSLRTRVGFEAAMARLGGTSTFMTSHDAGLHGRESLRDVATVLSRFIDAIVIRTFSQELIANIAKWSRVPVINGLSDSRHPCQALADMMTIREAFGTLSGLRLVFVGDGNNVAKSLAIACGRLGVAMTLCSPPDYVFDEAFLAHLETTVPDLELAITDDLTTAVRGADAIYTDVWVSMGQEDEAKLRRQRFAAFQITEQTMAAAPAECRFLHCLPAHRGEEVTDAVIDGGQSLVYQQAENRMHIAAALLVTLIS